MKEKTIKKALHDKHSKWLESIIDPAVKELAAKGTIITGGAIASMLLREEVNDYDMYFRDEATTLAVAKYYVDLFNSNGGHNLKVDRSEEGRIRIVVESGRRGETASSEDITDSGEIEDTYTETEKAALETKEEGKPKFRPIFLSTNAITLSGKVQLVLRFYGDPDSIHENYDFIHCTNYWTSWNNELVLRKEALVALMTKELRYVGSKYPVCSIIRLRKFIQRQWTINAGQILKILMQISKLDLTDHKVLEDQLTGVDSAYFRDVLEKLEAKDPTKVDTAYLVEIIDQIF